MWTIIRDIVISESTKNIKQSDESNSEKSLRDVMNAILSLFTHSDDLIGVLELNSSFNLTKCSIIASEHAKLHIYKLVPKIKDQKWTNCKREGATNCIAPND